MHYIVTRTSYGRSAMEALSRYRHQQMITDPTAPFIPVSANITAPQTDAHTYYGWSDEARANEFAQQLTRLGHYFRRLSTRPTGGRSYNLYPTGCPPTRSGLPA